MPLRGRDYSVASATAAVVVAAAAAVVTATAYEEDEDQNDDPAAAVAAQKVVAHSRLPPFSLQLHSIPVSARRYKVGSILLQRISNRRKNEKKALRMRKRKKTRDKQH